MIVDPLVLLQRENPDLPAVPPTTAIYEVWEVWFQEAIRRITIGSVRRTREETLKLNDQLLHYQLQCAYLLKNKASIREVGELADLEFQAKKKACSLSHCAVRSRNKKRQQSHRPPRRHVTW